MQALNPHRVNLGRIGLLWDGREIRKEEIQLPDQRLNLSTGHLLSLFSIYNVPVDVSTVASPTVDAVAFEVHSDAFINGSLNIFLDFPYPRDVAKLYEKPDSPYMGTYSESSSHRTSIQKWGQHSQILHEADSMKYYINVAWSSDYPAPNFSRLHDNSHRYILNITGSTSVSMTVRFSSDPDATAPSMDDVKSDSARWWNEYWNTGAFIDCTNTLDRRAHEIQRRTILSQYLLAINAAGTKWPAAEGLVRSHLPGKQTEAWWLLAHWERWGKWERIGSVIPYTYEASLNFAMKQAKARGYQGANWGAIYGLSTLEDNIENQPDPLYFAELEYRAFPTSRTLKKWHKLVEETTKFMTDIVVCNRNLKKNDFCELPEVVGKTIERGNKTGSWNPTFNLAYWRFGLNVARKWYERQNLSAPPEIKRIYDNLSPFPVSNESYILAEGTINMWNDSIITSSPPKILGIYGILPPDQRLNLTIFKNTLANIYRTFYTPERRPAEAIPKQFNNTSISHAHFGTSFPILAMTNIRMGDVDQAVDWLVHPDFGFDDAGMPAGSTETSNESKLLSSGSGIVPTPYFPGAGGLLMAIAMLADGWDGAKGGKWPKSWNCQSEGFVEGI
jgi:hypothetical protein